MSRRETLLVWIIAALVGLGALDYFVVQPMRARLAALSAEAERLESELRGARVLMDNRALIESRWQSYVEAGLEMEESAQRLRVQQHLTRWAQETGVDLATLASGGARQGEPFEEIQFVVRGSGPLQAVVEFLHELRRSPFPLRVKSCEIGDERGGEGDLSLRLTLSTIRLAANADAQVTRASTGVQP
ncbi:MAG: hypothetical protein ACODAQ_03075 [Phycisphaeraceae bacterium]